MTRKRKSEATVVEAVGSSGASGGPLAPRIEAAMSAAIDDCYANGIVDPEEHRAAMLAARDRVKAEYAAERAAEAEAAQAEATAAE